MNMLRRQLRLPSSFSFLAGVALTLHNEFSSVPAARHDVPDAARSARCRVQGGVAGRRRGERATASPISMARPNSAVAAVSWSDSAQYAGSPRAWAVRLWWTLTMTVAVWCLLSSVASAQKYETFE